MVLSYDVVVGLQRGVRLFGIQCLVSGLVAPLLLLSSSRAKVTIAVVVSASWLLSGPHNATINTIAAAHAALLGSVLYSAFPSLNMFWKFSIMFALIHGFLFLVNRIKDYERLRSLFGLSQKMYSFITDSFEALAQFNNSLLRWPAVMAAGVAFLPLMSFYACILVFSEVLAVDLPWLRAKVRQQRLAALKAWHNQVATRGLRYSHPPLQHGGVPARFRLLKLLPRWPLGEIHCQLVEAELGGASCPPYQAISYHWGSGRPTEAIYIDGRPFLVSSTVLDLLYRLSRYGRSRYIWIDSVCINQADGVEKGGQIALMRSIYKHASGVVIWLDGLPEPWQAHWMLSTLSLHIAFGTVQSGIDTVRTYSEVFSHMGWEQMAAIYCHPWFFRMWVIQEAASAVSQEAVSVLTPTITLTWSVITFVAQGLMSSFPMAFMTTFMTQSVQRLPVGMLHASIMKHLAKADPDSPTQRLPFLMASLTWFDASDPLDLVYATLGLLDPEDPVHTWLKPDYTKRPEEMFTALARGFLSTPDGSRSCSEILSCAGLGYSSRLTGAGLPSWAPDWTSLGTRSGASTSHLHFERISSATRYDAAAGTKLQAAFPGDAGEMHIRGSRIDRVAPVGPIITYCHDNHRQSANDGAAPTVGAILLEHLSSRALVLRHARRPYPTGQPLHEVFWRTCVGDTQFARPAPAALGAACLTWEYLLMVELAVSARSGSVASIQNLTQVVEFSGEEGVDPEGGDVFVRDAEDDDDALARTSMEWNSARAHCCAGRVICVTESGWVAVCPPGIRSGDEIWLLHGMSTPFVLRSATGGRWNLVGEAYVHGLMDGEAVGMGGSEEVLIVV